MHYQINKYFNQQNYVVVFIKMQSNIEKNMTFM